jgi:hypothetical protein
LARFLRRHRTALLALAVYNLVFFFPVVFMGRVVSPNDVFRNFSPWNMGRPLDVTHAQNSLLNDPPTAYFKRAITTFVASEVLSVSTPVENLTIPPIENLTVRRGDEPQFVGTS